MCRLGETPLLLWATIALHFGQIRGIYVPLREYAGSTFFNGWDYYGDVDNTTWGNVTYLSQPDAVSNKLTYINSAQNAIIKVDNTTTIAPGPLVHRNSVRITTQDSYGLGTLWLIDAVHLPFGCSVWPSFWSLGANILWPNGGEMDIIEAINLMPNNQVALHTTYGCFDNTTSSSQSGTVLQNDCSVPEGCIVAENKPNSYGQTFAAAGGGVWALQMDVSGIFVWFWSRPNIPTSISSATSTSNMDIATFGTPTASYPATGCNITQFFVPQQLVLLITLCGVWAGVPSIYSMTCPGTCIDNVIGPGSTYDDAYFEISYLRTYITQELAASQSGHTTTTVATAAATPAGSSVKANRGKRTDDVWSTSVVGVLGLGLVLGWMVVG